MRDEELRALDNFIAEHVMGWTLIDRKAVGWMDGPPVWNTGKTGEDESPTWQDFRPTTDPAAAMQVLERIIDSGVVLTVYKGVNESGERRYCFGAKKTDGYEDAETLPLAIAKFAKALFEKEPGK